MIGAASLILRRFDMLVKERLNKLRELMKQHNIDAYIIVTDDYHGSEYVGDYFKEREFMSGFTGSAGTLVILPDKAYLWTDGRYFIQAAKQLSDSTITLMKINEPGVPDIPKFMAECASGHTGYRIGFDGRTISTAFAKELMESLTMTEAVLVPDYDLVDEIWEDRPHISAEPVWQLDTRYAGDTAENKLKLLRGNMREASVDMMMVAALDETAWLLNLRGNDVNCTPVFLSYMLIMQDKAILYANEKSFDGTVRKYLDSLGVELRPYNEIYEDVHDMSYGVVELDPATVNYRLLSRVSEDAVVMMKESPVKHMKAVKNETEQDNIRKAHIKDGVAVCRFICWLQKNVAAGTITELDAAAQLEKYRREQEGYIENSFDSIIAYGEHGAIVHYEPTEETNILLKPYGLCLTDTGGHYMEGTTDITRTIPLGELTPEEKKAYTLVLKGHLALAAAVFKEGMCGANLDILARMPLWENGMDFNHGTGHGVGYILNVHEGPQRIHWKIGRQNVPIEAGMVTSDEPGYYLEGKFGIRHENLVLTRRYGDGLLCFENLTMVPFDTDALDMELMTDVDKMRLNKYHEKVYENISPYLEGEELGWLKEKTRKI